MFAHADGFSDLGRRVKFTLDTLCPLHGATKPIVVAAFFTLVEEGKVKLSDFVDKYVPFPQTVSVGKGGRKTKRVQGRATLRHLLAMTAGLGYDDSQGYRSIMKKLEREDIDALPAFCGALGAVPLQAEPSRRYHYSYCTDVLGRVCEVVSGDRIDRFVETRILLPLGMKDTHFQQALPQRKRRRLAKLYAAIKAPRRSAWAARKTGGRRPPFALKEAAFPRAAPKVMSCGGGIMSYGDFGMVSSVRDYARFCQMLLSGGLIPGSRRRLLRDATVRSWWQDGLVPYQGPDGRVRGWNDAPCPPDRPRRYWDRVGWSLLNTHLNFEQAATASSRPRTGRVMWMGGGGGAYWSIDARRRLVCVSFAPVIGGRGSEDDGLGKLANDATPFANAAVDKAVAAARQRKRMVREYSRSKAKKQRKA